MVIMPSAKLIAIILVLFIEAMFEILFRCLLPFSIAAHPTIFSFFFFFAPSLSLSIYIYIYIYIKVI